MAAVHKVTVSLPDQLATHIEDLRKKTDRTRSRVITDLLWRGWQDVEQEEREDRYRAAYSAMPDRAAGRSWSDAAAADFFEDADPWNEPDADPRAPNAKG